MSGMRELIDTELDAVSGGHHGGITGRELPPGMQGGSLGGGGGAGEPGMHMAYSPLIGLMGEGHQGTPGLFNFGNFGNIVTFGNIVIEQNIAVQIGVAVGDNASVTNLLGSQTNLSSIAFLAA